MRVLPRTAARKMTMERLLLLTVIACCLGKVRLTSNNQCLMANIPVQPNFDQSKYTGVWYQVELYPGSWIRERQPWQDFSQRVYEVRPGQIRMDINYRNDKNADCSPEMMSFSNQVRPGYYKDTGLNGDTTDANIIVYTGYERFAVEFVCHDVYYDIYDICRDPEVIFWSRTKQPVDADIARARQLLPRLCVDERQRYIIVQDLVSTCNRKINRRCRLDDIPVANPFSSVRATGVWYVIRYYPPGQYEPSTVYDNFNYEYDGRKLVARFRFTDPMTKRCNQDVTMTFREETSGIYDHYDPFTNKTVVTKIVYASSNRQYGIIFTCNVLRGEICVDPATLFASRGKAYLTAAELDELEAFIPRLCVDPSVYKDIVHTGDCPPTKEEPAMPNELPVEDQDLMRAQQEMLVASRDKFLAETEMLRMRKRLLELQIQLMIARNDPEIGRQID